MDLFSELDEWEIINPFDYHTGEDLKLMVDKVLRREKQAPEKR